jgi:hypothetical protein
MSLKFLEIPKKNMPMCNNTVEDYYKIAVKKRYEEVKNGVNFNFLNSPTRGKLRTLCWELFQQQNRTQDDLSVFNSLLGLPFDINRKNKFDEQIDKFRPIETFFKGKTDPLNIEVVDMAAILVDFESRPFNKFRIHNLYRDEIQNDDENDIDIEISNPEIGQGNSSGDLENFLDEKEKEKGIVKGTEDESEKGNEVVKGISVEVIQPKPITLFGDTKPEKETTKPPVNWKPVIIGVAIILVLGLAGIFFAFPNKECMQWSDDHYEIVDCDLKIQGIGTFSNIEILDPTLVNLKKVKVCDTTTCFDKNGVAIIWYAKTANGIDFFNVHGRHPENNSPLRPVTHYILNKYVRK